MRSRPLTARLRQLKSEMHRYGIHPISVRVAVTPPALATRIRIADLAAECDGRCTRKAS